MSVTAQSSPDRDRKVPSDKLSQTPQDQHPLTKHRGRVWTQGVEVTVAALRARLRAIRAREKQRIPLLQPEAEAVCSGIEGLLDRAEKAASGKYPKYYSFGGRWRGNCIEAAFQSLHKAEAEIVRLYDDAEVDAEVPEAVARAEAGLNRDDLRRIAAQELVGMESGHCKRTTLSKIVQIGHEAADRQHSRIRSFRNVVLVTAALITALVLLFVCMAYMTPTSVQLCFEPTNLPTTKACPTGDGPGREPSSLDVVIVALLGLLGGSLAAAVSIRNLRGTSTPYDIPVALAFLKVPAGALTAIGALIAIRGQFIPGLSALDTQEQILAYALVFGYAQQLLTGLIDKRAHSLLDKVPSKDAEQSRPPPQPLPPTASPRSRVDEQPRSTGTVS